ncbi:MAG: hypothetical protein P4L50_20545 [Anaerolineaceae bacterium]|nr:hypothetical protein [Anaerolineaceae bacterium]
MKKAVSAGIVVLTKALSKNIPLTFPALQAKIHGYIYRPGWVVDLLLYVKE